MLSCLSLVRLTVPVGWCRPSLRLESLRPFEHLLPQLPSLRSCESEPNEATPTRCRFISRMTSFCCDISANDALDTWPHRALTETIATAAATGNFHIRDRSQHCYKRHYHCPQSNRRS
ncbi:hypothetical protein BDW22DRAFT_173493 [Trametopsis cervina]|nr:hypothetical protein BDW22DRAFT_173493 [Trametopsis cervina]